MTDAERDQAVSIMAHAVADNYPCVDPDELADDPDVDDTPIGRIHEEQRLALEALLDAGWTVRAP